ncbi:MAG: cytochrome c oxidase subunit II [Bdellovibrionota bacterium]
MWWLPAAVARDTFMPPAATEIASKVDDIYAFLLWGSLLSFIILIGGMIYFVWKYKRQTGSDKTAYITHNHTAEFLWSFIPFVVFMFAFAWGWIVYHEMRSFPDNALEVHVIGKKWDWRFLYKNGKEITTTFDSANKAQAPTMVVPLGRAVKLIMSSEKMNPKGDDPTDRPVLHSFFIPAFRVKQDVVPGRYTAIWFQADKLGEYQVFCTEFCGAQHYAMQAKVRVVSVADFEAWLSSEGNADLSLVDKGRALYASKACIGCHTLDGVRGVGPSFKGLFGKEEAMDDGKKIMVDENYLRESILDPQKTIVATYSKPSPMPPFAGQLSDDDLSAIIEFIKTVK